MSEIRTEAISWKGTPTDLAGSVLKIGDAAPGFNLQNNALEYVKEVAEHPNYDAAPIAAQASSAITIGRREWTCRLPPMSSQYSRRMIC